MNANRAQLKQLMYGMNKALDASKDKQQVKPAYPDTPTTGAVADEPLSDKENKLLNIELPDSMKFFIIS